MKAKLQIVITAFCAMLGAGSVANAEISFETQRALQDRAPEKLQIEIQELKKKRKLGGGFNFEVVAKVLAVEKSDSGLKTGESLKIHYWLHNPRKPVPSGSYPIEVQKGMRYKAYLGPASAAYRALDDEEETIYFPTAASGSFHQVSVPTSAHRNQPAEQDGAGQPATRPESK